MIKRLLIGLSLLGFFGAPVWAAFEDTGTGARATALAGGYAAAADDVLSLIYNPAGLANVNRKEITSEYAKLFAGLSDGSNISQTFLAYGQPISYGGTVAIGWKQFSLDSLYKERTLSVGYGEWITSKIAAGFALKQLHHEFTSPGIIVDDAGSVQNGTPSFFSKYGNSKTAYAADLGVIVKPMERYTIGVSIQDFNEPNVAVSSEDHEVVNKTVRVGVKYDAPKNLKLMGGVVSHKSVSGGPDVTWTAASEKTWGEKESGAFILRGSIANGSREFRQIALGAGYLLSSFQVDYAFVFNVGGLSIGDTAGTHRFSLTYRFGRDRSELGKAKTKKKAEAKRAKIDRDAEIEALLEEGLPSTTPVRTAKVKSHESTGPGLTNVKVQTTPAAPEPSVQPSDYAVPLTNGPATSAPEKEIEPLTRIQFIVRTLTASTGYLIESAHRSSAEARMSALDSVFPTLIGYVRGSGAEMTDLMTQSDQLETARKEYARMVWDGASAADRLASLVHTLEAWFVPILRARVWDAHDGRDIRYKAWLDTALAEHDRLIQANVSAPLRLDSIRLIASRALDFERQPREPIAVPTVEAPVTPVVVPTPAPVAPVKVTPAPKPVVTKPTPKVGRGGVPALYKVHEGDTLINLAERFYGDAKRWREIYMLNQDRLGRGGNLTVGQMLVMPPQEKKN
jgi:hypothetical protein